MSFEKILDAAAVQVPALCVLVALCVMFLRFLASDRREWMALIGTILAQLPTAAEATNENTAAAKTNTSAINRNTAAIKGRDRTESETAG